MALRSETSKCSLSGTGTDAHYLKQQVSNKPGHHQEEEEELFCVEELQYLAATRGSKIWLDRPSDHDRHAKCQLYDAQGLIEVRASEDQEMMEDLQLKASRRSSKIWV